MLDLRSADDVMRARLAARELVRQAGLGAMDQTRFATAVSELGHNAVRHATSGQCELTDLSDDNQLRLQARVSDTGPGIADIARALTDGYSTVGSHGAGLPGARRLVDVFAIESTPAGTRVMIQMVRARRA